MCAPLAFPLASLCAPRVPHWPQSAVHYTGMRRYAAFSMPLLRALPLTALALALGGAGVWWFAAGSAKVAERAEEPAPLRDKAPAFLLEDMRGGKVSSVAFAGRVRVITVWASWCPLCAEELAELDALQRTWGERIAVIAINRAEPEVDARAFLEKVLGKGYTLRALMDPEDSFYKTIGGFAMPETLFLNAAGETVLHQRGPLAREEARTIVERILRTAPPATGDAS